MKGPRHGIVAYALGITNITVVGAVAFGPLILEAGSPAHLLAAGYLIVAHVILVVYLRRARTAHAARRNLLAHLVRVLPVSYMVLDGDRRFVFADGKALLDAGTMDPRLHPDAIMGELLPDVPHDPRVVELYERALATGESGTVSLLWGDTLYYVHVLALPSGIEGRPDVRAAAMTVDVSKAMHLSEAVQRSIKVLREGDNVKRAQHGR